VCVCVRVRKDHVEILQHGSDVNGLDQPETQPLPGQTLTALMGWQQGGSLGSHLLLLPLYEVAPRW